MLGAVAREPNQSVPVVGVAIFCSAMKSLHCQGLMVEEKKEVKNSSSAQCRQTE
jgi:hypothetical protein